MIAYSKELADQVCAYIVEGMSLKRVSHQKDMPCVASIFYWIRTNPEFKEMYEKAKREQADALIEEMQDIADMATPDTCNVAKLQVDTRKWVASKMKPKKYGDSSTLNLADNEGGKLSIGCILKEIDPKKPE